MIEKKTHFQGNYPKCVCRRNNTWNEVNCHKKKKEINTKRSKVSLFTNSQNDNEFFSYWGIAQHTIVTRPVLPGNGPNCPLPIGG